MRRSTTCATQSSRVVRRAGAVGVALLGLLALPSLDLLRGHWLEENLATYLLPVLILGSGIACLLRARVARTERRPWQLIGVGLVLYACGTVAYSIELASSPAVPFPSVADALWLSLYPLAFIGVALLVRARHPQVNASLWLDGFIGGSVVTALCAVFVLHPVFELTVDEGMASAVRLAYPTFDLLLTGFAVVLWGVGGWRLDTWLLLAVGFALIALSDSVYVAAQAGEGWSPGSLVDLAYAGGSMLLAGAAWRSQAPLRTASTLSRVGLPVGFAICSLALVSYEAVVALDPLAVVMIRLTLLAVVLRLALTLWWLSRQRADLEALAASDPLTGLGNYRAFHEQLERNVTEARVLGTALSVVALDLDHFKMINDTYGHGEGDKLLQATALTLSRTVRDGDFVARVGGEEFGLLLKGAGAETAAALAERCRAVLAALEVPGAPLSCSAGVACFPAHGKDPSQLLESADGALYWAKRSGRNRTRLYDPRHVVALSLKEQRREVEALLDTEAPLAVVFQPLMEMATGRVAGYEALARFECTFERPPEVWFAQAHRCGLGAVLEARAIRAALAVPHRPAGTFLTLNVSPAALLSPKLQDALPDDLSELVVELTEHEAFSEDGALELELGALKRRGARIALDDAGAGHAGLQQLIRIRPDILKIDRSLIAHIHEDPSKMALLEALARFATTTGAAVCAEGVEELAELRALAGFDVTYAQGHALARPASAWPSIPEDVAAQAASAAGHGMRLAVGSSSNGTPSLGEMTDVLARVGTLEEFEEALTYMTKLLDGHGITLSSVDADARCVVTFIDHDRVPTGERYRFEDYPTTEHVIERQVIGQVIAGDPAGDRAELRFLEEVQMGALLLVPVVFDQTAIGLLEIYRRSPQPWTSTQVDQARVLANHVAASLVRLSSDPKWLAASTATT
jgi:diguanylate cyclase (GGDEF)-like protein